MKQALPKLMKRRLLAKARSLLIVILILIFPSQVEANHACGNTCDQFTDQGACTHGCWAGGYASPDFHRDEPTVESVPAPLGSDGGNQQVAQQAVQQYNEIVSGNTQVDYAIDASQHQNQGTVQDLIDYQQQLAAEVAAAQDEVAAGAEAAPLRQGSEGQAKTETSSAAPGQAKAQK